MRARLSDKVAKYNEPKEEYWIINEDETVWIQHICSIYTVASGMVVGCALLCGDS